MNKRDEHTFLKKRDQKVKCPVDERWKYVERYEREGMYDKAIFELIQIFKENSDKENRVKSLEKLKELYLDLGKVDKALKCLDNLISLFPNEVRFFREKGIIWEENEEIEKAREVYIKGFEQTGDKKFLAYIKDLESSMESITIPEDDFVLEEINNPNTSGDAYKVLDLFSGREGVYAKQWVSNSGECGYSPVYEALTPNIIQQHFEGTITLGVYQIRLDNTVSFVAFDIDIDKDILKNVISKKEEFESKMRECKKVAEDVDRILAEKQIKGYIEFSGNKGYHVWVFLNSPIAARIARHFCIEVKKRVKLPHGIHLDIFPRQSFVKQEKLGNLIKIPFGFHKKSGKYSFFVDGDFKKIKNQRKFLHEISKIPKSLIVSAIAEFESENLYLPPVKVEKKTDNQADYNPFEEREFLPENDEEFQRVLNGCNVIKTIYQKGLNSESLTAQEITVLTYTLGCLEHGVEIVNYILKKANVGSQFFLKSRLKGNPTSCEKIRNRVPEIASSVKCDCVFDKDRFTYNTPNIYAKGDVNFSSPMLDILGFEKLFNEYLKLKRESLKIQKKIAELEKKINSLFEQAEIDSVKLPQGTLKRKKLENGGYKLSFEIE